MNRSKAVLSVCCFFSLFLSTDMYAQGVQATLRGRVSDSSGASVPKAEIEVRNAETNVLVKTVSDGAGLYAAPYLIPGSYRLTARASGFKTFPILER